MELDSSTAATDQPDFSSSQHLYDGQTGEMLAWFTSKRDNSHWRVFFSILESFSIQLILRGGLPAARAGLSTTFVVSVQQLLLSTISTT